ncbi:MAG: twin-arginine translocation signal domain-containing protein [Acidobacteriota bacterium]
MSMFRPNRRDFLRTGALAGAALTVPSLVKKAGATTLVETEYFDLTASSAEFIRNVQLHQTTGAPQSFAWNGGDSLYVLQTLNDANGDMTFTRLDPTTHDETGYMTLTGAGHGVAMGIDNNGSGADYYWTESEEATSGTGTCRGRKLQRFNFSSGATYSHSDCEVFDPTIHLEGTTQWQVTCSIDQKYGRIAVRYAKQQEGGSLYYNLYDLADFNNHTYSPYFSASVKQPSTPSGAGVSQGWCLFGSWIYMLWGNKESAHCPGTQQDSVNGGTMVGRFSLNDNSAWTASNTAAAYTLCDREPEGVGIRKSGSSYQLHLGFSGNSSGSGAHYFSTYYKDVLVGP